LTQLTQTVLRRFVGGNRTFNPEFTRRGTDALVVGLLAASDRTASRLFQKLKAAAATTP
jgi:hypothetical protein